MRWLSSVGLWILQIFGALVFGLVGSLKLTSDPDMVHEFAVIGVGQWFRVVTGAIEVTGAVLLLLPALSGLGAILLMCVMVGAITAHLTVLGGSPGLPAFLLVLMVVISYGRRKQTIAFFRLKFP
jgi:uncharacterized membrane protein YphA (DoxX/SURF4 family)